MYDEKSPVSNDAIVNQNTQHTILIEWNDTTRNYPKNKTLHQLFEEQVKRCPDQTAILFDTRILTYRELNDSANQLAHLLSEKGVRPDTLVAIACDRSPELIIGILAILKAGGAYVPLDPSYPAERLAYMLEDSHAPLLLTQSHLLADLPRIPDAEIIPLDRRDMFMSYSTANPNFPIQSSHLAYVIYTSGSTGKPKGVMIEHKSICDRLFWWQEHVPLTAEDRYLHQFSFNFDGAAVSLWWPLLNGVVVFIPESQQLSDIDYLVNTIKNNKITSLLSTPSLLHLILDRLVTQQDHGIRRLMLAGESFPKDILKKAQQLEKCRVYHFYGPTESTIIATSYDATEKTCMTATVPIGRPVANTYVYILDPDLKPVPVGVMGELYIGGEGLARGYLNQPALTAEKFIANPFLSDEERREGKNLRLYKTGDLCRWLDDGTIEYVERVDE